MFNPENVSCQYNFHCKRASNQASDWASDRASDQASDKSEQLTTERLIERAFKRVSERMNEQKNYQIDTPPMKPEGQTQECILQFLIIIVINYLLIIIKFVNVKNT